VTLTIPPVRAVFVNFANCLDQRIVQSTPLELQFVPLFVSAKFDPSTSPYPLNLTVYGNVSGLATVQAYPAPNDPQWQNPNDTVGKIVDMSQTNDKFTTLFTSLNVLTFTSYHAPASRFCGWVTQGRCPLGPVFYANA
jgi:ML-like domain